MAAASRRLPDAMVSGFSRREAQQSDARLDHRPRCSAVPQGSGPTGQARLSGACSNGEPACSGGRHASDFGHRDGGTRGRVADHPGNHRIILGADKAYDVAEFVADLREYNVTPHVAQNTTNRRSAIDSRTTRHSGYAVSGQVRKRIEEVFGWTKATAGFRKTRHRGLVRVGWMFTLTATAYNLVRLR